MYECMSGVLQMLQTELLRSKDYVSLNSESAESKILPAHIRHSINIYWIGFDWIELGWLGLTGLNWIGLGWSGLGWVGLSWVEMNGIELNWAPIPPSTLTIISLCRAFYLKKKIFFSLFFGFRWWWVLGFVCLSWLFGLILTYPENEFAWGKSLT